jgi:hypothetical protein
MAEKGFTTLGLVKKTASTTLWGLFYKSFYGKIVSGKTHVLYKFNVVLVSISPTFYEQLLRQNPFTKKLQTKILST